MAIQLVPLPLPGSADVSKLADFGREVRGIELGSLMSEEFKEIEESLYKYSALLFRNVNLSPEQQYAFTKAFDPEADAYGHGNNKIESAKTSILQPYLKTIPRVPQVQLIGHGTVRDHEGITEAHLKHASHRAFHKTHLSGAEEAAGDTRFFRWHMDAALYGRALPPPRVTTLYGIRVPQGEGQVVKYGDATIEGASEDELRVPLGTTAFVSGKTMFDIQPRELKSLAVRTSAKYAPHPFAWMATARAVSTGLGLVSEGRERADKDLPPWKEEDIQVLPVCWKNPVTGELHLQLHPCGVKELHIEPVPDASRRDEALYPDGAHLTDLEEVRRICYKWQRPGIAPNLVYPHDWREGDLMLFHNRGVMHSVVGKFTEDQIRVFHQCNFATSDFPIGPNDDDIRRWA
ncbi:hypothetical protein HGRIS_008665 [Hohenbuehelia grisea]|uniref:TauD/TfdA-like domain-containing protein n=1 Tax=Hohenbuehelia grisea TaxID=104357 RepID=A0ABR3J9Q1_9AGAR